MSDDVDQMEAGRELDARVAREVMGWTDSPSDFACWRTPDGRDIGDPVIDEWSPSTDIADAWAVVEKVGCRKHWMFSVSSIQAGYDSGPLYEVAFQRGEKSGSPRWSAESRHGDMEDSIPLAICRAALKACREVAKRSQ